MSKGLLLLFSFFVITAFQQDVSVNVRVSSHKAPPAEQIKAYNELGSKFSDQIFSKLSHNNFEENPMINQVIDYANIDYGILNAAIIFYTNKFRVSKEMQPLEFRSILRDAAAFHTLQMVNMRFYGHTNPHFRKFKTVVDRMDFLGFEGRNLAENLGKGFVYHYQARKSYWYDKRANGRNIFYYGSGDKVKSVIQPRTYRELAKSIVADWVRSPQHRQNILNDDYTWVGVASLLDFVGVENNKIPKVIVTQVLGG